MMQKTVYRVVSVLLASMGLFVPSDRASRFAQAQSAQVGSLNSFRDANHRLCSEPQAEDGRMRGLCFLFRKQGDEVVGQFFEPYTERGICLHGVAHDSEMSGFARQRIFSQTPDPQIEAKFSGNELNDWDSQIPALKLARGRIAEFEGESEIAGYSAIAAYDIAWLTVGDFYRYNAGRILPPPDCQNL